MSKTLVALNKIKNNKISRDQAIELYLKNNKTAAIMVVRMVLWKPELTLSQNSKALNVSVNVGFCFAQKYALDYKRPGEK